MAVKEEGTLAKIRDVRIDSSYTSNLTSNLLSSPYKDRL